MQNGMRSQNSGIHKKKLLNSGHSFTEFLVQRFCSQITFYMLGVIQNNWLEKCSETSCNFKFVINWSNSLLCRMLLSTQKIRPNHHFRLLIIGIYSHIATVYPMWLHLCSHGSIEYFLYQIYYISQYLGIVVNHFEALLERGRGWAEK